MTFVLTAIFDIAAFTSIIVLVMTSLGVFAGLMGVSKFARGRGQLMRLEARIVHSTSEAAFPARGRRQSPMKSALVDDSQRIV